MARVVLDGGADARDVHVDAAVEGLQGVPAHALHQRFAREHAAGAVGQSHQQVELMAGERPLAPVEADDARLAVDLEPPEAQHRPVVAGRRRDGAGWPCRRASSSRGLKGLGR